MSASLATMAAAQGIIRDTEGTKMFEFEADALRMANQLSMTDWREWMNVAVPPFPEVWVEWHPRDYLPPNPDGHVRTVAMHIRSRAVETVLVKENVGKGDVSTAILKEQMSGSVVTYSQNIVFWFEYKGEAVALPWAIICDTQVPGREHVAHEFLELGWGGPWLKQWGRPTKHELLVRQDFYEGPMSERLVDICTEFAGVPRVALGCLALLNAERSKQVYPESYRSGRTLVKRGNVPAYKPSIVRVYPDSPRYVRDQAAHEPTGIRKREHDVREHFRQLPGRKVRIRAHKRGDKELGRVRSSYRVTSAPEVILTEPKEDA